MIWLAVDMCPSEYIKQVFVGSIERGPTVVRQ